MRVRNWDVALGEWARTVIGKPYVWGETDCASLVRAATAAMYGRDLFPGVRPYKSARGATHTLKSIGSIRAVLLDAGAEELDLSSQQTGDIILHSTDGHDVVEVVLQPGVLLCSSPENDVYLQRQRADTGVVLRLPNG